MNIQEGAATTASSEELTRRTFVARCAAAVASGAALCTLPGLAEATRAVEADKATPATDRTPVLTFHIDRPYVDMTGMATPYLRPVGTRSGQPLAELSEEEYLRRYVYV